MESTVNINVICHIFPLFWWECGQGLLATMVYVISEVTGNENDSWSDKIGILYVLYKDGKPESLIKCKNQFVFEWY